MREDKIEFSDPPVHELPEQEVRIAERVAEYNSGDMDGVVCLDEHEELCDRLKASIHSVSKYNSGITTASSSNGNSSY